FQTYHSRGLPDWPICSPSAPAIAAALNPDTTDGYLYFVAKHDGSNTHAFARTYAEHQANIRLYWGDGATEEPSTLESPAETQTQCPWSQEDSRLTPPCPAGSRPTQQPDHAGWRHCANAWH